MNVITKFAASGKGRQAGNYAQFSKEDCLVGVLWYRHHRHVSFISFIRAHTISSIIRMRLH
jgi:hypothetical protein